MIKQYYMFLLKKRIPFIIGLIIGFTLIAIIRNCVENSFLEQYSGDSTKFYVEEITTIPWLKHRNYCLNIYYVLIALSCLIITIKEFSFKMNKIEAIKLYSFPITRKELYITKYLLGLTEIIIPFTICYFASVFILLNNSYSFNVWGIILYYPLALIAIGLSFSYSVFFFTRGNNLLDGVAILLISVVGSTFVLYCQFSWNLGSPFVPYQNLPYPGLNFVTMVSEAMMAGKNLMPDMDLGVPVVTIVWVVLAIASVILFFNSINKTRKEDIGASSESWFGYKTLLPVLLVPLGANPYTLILGVIFTYFGYALYKRSFRFDKNTIITVVTIIICQLFYLAVFSLCIPNYYL